MALCLLMSLALVLFTKARELTHLDHIHDIHCVIGSLPDFIINFISYYAAAIAYIFTKHPEDTISSFNKLKGRTYS